MELISNSELDKSEVELLFCPVLQSSEQIEKLIKSFYLSEESRILSRIKKENFQGKKGQLFVIDNQPALVIYGVGQEQKMSVEDWRQAAGQLVRFLEGYQAGRIGLILSHWFKGSQDANKLGQALATGLNLALYKFDKYKKSDDKLKVDIKELNIEIKTDKKVQFKKGWARGLLLATGTNQARDLVNEPAGQMTPTFLAETARNLAGRGSGITVKILEKEDCAKLGMDAFLGVAQGSVQPPKFIHLTYKPKVATRNKLAIVGKGITFDSGGLNIKTGEGMNDMKVDMGGAATVLGLFSILAELKPRAEVHGIIAACENMPSGSALKPGDVISNMQNKTIEIGNTDAEGRVTLADSLAYAQKKGIKTIVDLATLTGAVSVALGTEYAALFANNKDLGKVLMDAIEISGEKIWPLPLAEEYKEMNKSLIADIKNIPSSRYGGAITAGLFLQEFIESDVAWAHLDIAGPAYAEKPFNSYIPAGGVGFGVRTLAEWLKSF